MSGMGADTTLTSLLPNQAKAFGDCPSPRCLYSGDVAVGTVPRYCRLYVVGQVVRLNTNLLCFVGYCLHIVSNNQYVAIRSKGAIRTG